MSYSVACIEIHQNKIFTIGEGLELRCESVNISIVEREDVRYPSIFATGKQFGDVVDVYDDAQDTQSSLLDLRNVVSVLGNGLGQLGIARHRPPRFPRLKKRN